VYWVNPADPSEYIPITEPIEKGGKGEGRSYVDHHFVVNKIDDAASQPISFTKAPKNEIVVIRCNEQNNLILYHSMEASLPLDTLNDDNGMIMYGDLTVFKVNGFDPY
jgi:hypothetical protein